MLTDEAGIEAEKTTIVWGDAREHGDGARRRGDKGDKKDSGETTYRGTAVRELLTLRELAGRRK